MNEEFKASKENDTYELVSLANDKNKICVKCVGGNPSRPP